MALTRVGHLSSATLLQLYRLLGSATAIVDHRNHIEDVVPGASPKLRECLSDIDAALRRAEEELAYKPRFDRVDINDDLAHAYEQLDAIIEEA